jgi:hypothetical protein
MPFGSKKSRGIRQNVRVGNLKRNVLGTVQNKAESFLPPEAAKDILNMHATEEGSWSADNVGYTLINDADTAYEAGASLDGMAWFTDSAFDDHLFVAINGKVGEVDPSTGVLTTIDAAAGFTAGNPVDFEGMNDVLYAVDGSIAAPRKWDGVSAADAAGWPVSDGTNTYSTPKYLLNHQDRLMGLNLQGGSDVWPSHFLLSDQNDPEAFNFDRGAASAFVGQCRPGDGQQIVGGGSIFVPASNQQQAVIFKTASTFMMVGNSGSDQDADQFRVVRINGSYGAINNKCIINVGNDILALDRFGVTSYTSLSSSGDIQPNAINSDLVKDTIATLNQNAKDTCWGIHLPHRREVIFYLPTGSATNCNAAIVYKYPAPGTDELPKWSRRTAVGTKFNLSCGVLGGDDFYIGTSNGFVGTMFTSSTYDGTGIPYRYEHPYMALGNEEQVKRVLHGFAHSKIRGDLAATMEARWKGGGNNDVTTCPLSLETTVGAAEYGAALMGTDYYGQREEIKTPFEPLGDGNRLKLIFKGTTGDTGPEYLGSTLIYESGGLVRHWN